MQKYKLASIHGGRTLRLVFLPALILVGPLALACTMEEARDIHEGPHKGLKGVCSNNGMEVSCIEQGGEDYSCSGPGGSFRGNDLGTLVFSACGCGSE